MVYVVPVGDFSYRCPSNIQHHVCVFPDTVPSNQAAGSGLRLISASHPCSLSGSGEGLSRPSSFSLWLPRCFCQQTEGAAGRDSDRCDSYQEKGSFPLMIGLVQVKNMVLGPNTDEIEFVLYCVCVCACAYMSVGILHIH